MLQSVCPKLPMRHKATTLQFYVERLGFEVSGSPDYPDYLMLTRDAIELHFFAFADLNPLENYGQIYLRVGDIEALYQSYLERGVPIHLNGPLQLQPWGQKEFSVLDPDHNLLTFGEEG